jgi:plasmid stabilization system protein ParE
VKRREVVFAPEARDDVFALFDWISAAVGKRVATKYIERLEAYCLSFLHPSGERAEMTSAKDCGWSGLSAG